jgi:hypothetical protein
MMLPAPSAGRAVERAVDVDEARLRGFAVFRAAFETVEHAVRETRVCSVRPDSGGRRGNRCAVTPPQSASTAIVRHAPKVPFGDCVDKKGDVFITDRGAAAIYEYAHGGSSPIATLQDASEEPQECSVDFKTGDLAVSNVLSGDGGSEADSVSIYKAAKGTPPIVTDSAIYDFGYCSYDNHSNLFVDGVNGNRVVVAELPSGKSQFTNLQVSGAKLLGAGGVRWAGKYLAVGDSGPTVYQFSISSGKATKEGSTTLSGGYYVGDFWISGDDIIGPGGGSGNVGVWKYPAGGGPIKSLSGFTDPVGATVSAGK